MKGGKVGLWRNYNNTCWRRKGLVSPALGRSLWETSEKTVNQNPWQEQVQRSWRRKARSKGEHRGDEASVGKAQ